MTEYEAATLAYRYAALWVGPGVAFVIGLGQIVTVAVGISIMRSANQRRDRELDEQRRDREQRAKREEERAKREDQRAKQEEEQRAKREEQRIKQEEQRARQEEQRARQEEQRAKREDQRHAETMEALRALIRGMDQQGEALRVLIERTGGRA